ncbi:cation diffusion facilitator family transporter [Psittacicella gerlachiana]|uniref:Uncharacterized protein n=1 Tax=Psittacicella gerlachiana TaxID=2028574 RepID=A0A3A1YB41_9GAMM|nr:cation diffusion facilitator family transporter [Psittacicella gerlachiana]RIY35352.1 hypothetical protein CKF59_03725 [Psittacicella gerlachiana]
MSKITLSPQEYKRIVSKASIAAICTALTLIVIKLTVVIMSNSISLYASLMDSVFDVACSVINLLILRKALKPADADHTFGHGKLEYFGILGQSIFIATLAIMLIVSAVSRFSTPIPIEKTTASVIILIISIIMTAILVTYQQKVIRQTDSEMIKVDQAHYKMDCLMNGSVAIAIIFAHYGYAKVDLVLAIIIGIYMLYSVYEMITTAINGLTDKVLPAEDLQLIELTIQKHPQVLGIHELRTRQAANTKYIQFHLELDNNILLREAHDICDELETTLLAVFPDALITIHPEPKMVAQAEAKGTYQAKTSPDLVDIVQNFAEQDEPEKKKHFWRRRSKNQDSGDQEAEN